LFSNTIRPVEQRSQFSVRIILKRPCNIDMSSQKGNISRTRKQKHQNRHAFKNDMHDTSGRTKMILGLSPEGLCKRCKDIIEWKIKYKKYKPLTKPATCVRCKGKTVKRAYYTVCEPCAKEAGVCAKCNSKSEIVLPPQNQSEQQKHDTELQFQLKQLSERQRRSYYRQLEKKGNDAQSRLELAKSFGLESGDENDASSDDDKSGTDDESDDGEINKSNINNDNEIPDEVLEAFFDM